MIRGSNGEAERDPNSALPEYESNSPEPGIPPPDYRDALQDVIVSSGPTVTVRSLIPRPHLAWKSQLFQALFEGISPRRISLLLLKISLGVKLLKIYRIMHCV